MTKRFLGGSDACARMLSAMRLRWPRRTLILLGLTVAAAVVRLTVFRPEPVPVTVFRVAPGRVEETVTNSKAGTVKTRREASLSPETGGRIEELPVKKGQRVEKGQLLLRLAAGDLRAEHTFQARSLEALRASEREACERSAQSEREAKRMVQLAEERIASTDLREKADAERQMAQASCEAAQARIRQGEAALVRARVTLVKTELRAPFAGVVAEISADLGEWIMPSPPGLPMPAVVHLMDTEAIYISAPLDEVDVGKVKAGLPVRVTMDAYSGRSFPGRVTRVAPFVADVQQQSRTFEVEVELVDEAFAHTLPPGVSADVEVVLDGHDGVLRIPAYALLEGGKVLVLRERTLVAVPVVVGLRNWEFAEVKQGLASGDQVVVSLDRAEVKEGVEAVATGEALK
jgi:HlyD family secretion protein